MSYRNSCTSTEQKIFAGLLGFNLGGFAKSAGNQLEDVGMDNLLS